MGKVYIIGEAGVNHNGSFDKAKELAYIAKEAGADAVKFQTFISEKLATRSAKKAMYQKILTTKCDDQLSMLKNLELSYDQFSDLKAYCEKIEIDFLSTAFDLDSVDFLRDLGVRVWKIPSGEITNYPYLKKIAQYNFPIIISTGMATMNEIKSAYDLIRNYNNNDITILHCTTAYPTQYEDVNLRTMLTIKEAFGEKIGYSDHTLGIEVPIAAVSLGATVIEKHFTIDRNLEGPDHKASLIPKELKAMISGIRNVELALGSAEKTLSDEELINKSVARKSIVAAKKIKKGEIFSESNLAVKRPGTGISPMRWEEIIGKKSNRDYLEDQLIVL